MRKPYHTSKRFALALIFVFLALCAELSAAEKAFIVSRVRVEYPLEARKQKMQGAGVYVLDLDAQGRVTAVHVARSSTHRILDQAAIKAFRQFRFQPGPRRAQMPATWKLSN